jgi:hypothetical protein
VTAPSNPYHDAWLELGGAEALYKETILARGSVWEARDRMVRRYAWAIPNEAALRYLVRYSPLVEMGAGNGYWAWAAAARGADIAPYDKTPPGRNQNSWMEEPDSTTVSPWKCWVPVREGTPEALRAHADRTLFLCWPPYADSMAFECLEHYTGSTIILIGEDSGGCTGDSFFFERLEDQFEEIHDEAVTLPQWPGLHDRLTVWRRVP